MSILKFRSYKRLSSWRDPEDGRLHTRRIESDRTIVLPPEYDDYLNRFGHVYRIEKSESGFSWCLYVDYKDHSFGWDQKANFCQVLVLAYNGGWRTALKRAKELFPKEAAFWIEGGFETERLPGDDEFDAWYDSLGGDNG